jgi:AraC-like DNA-binding protein
MVFLYIKLSTYSIKLLLTSTVLFVKMKKRGDGMEISSEKVSYKFLEINNCNFQNLKSNGYSLLRSEGRADYYILYILRGSCTLVERGREVPVEEGSILLYRPHERQEYYFKDGQPAETAFVHFSGRAVEEILRECGFADRRVIFIGDGKPVRIFREMVDEFSLKKPFGGAQSAALLLHFLSVAARRAKYREEEVNVGLQHNMDEVLRYMHRHVAENRDVEFFAAMCHQSVGRFAHAFKEITGLPPRQYMLRIKVETACHLLASTTLSLSEIAREVGVSDTNYFSRLIKKHTGKTPAKLR